MRESEYYRVYQKPISPSQGDSKSVLCLAAVDFPSVVLTEDVSDLGVFVSKYSNGPPVVEIIPEPDTITSWTGEFGVIATMAAKCATSR